MKKRYIIVPAMLAALFACGIIFSEPIGTMVTQLKDTLAPAVEEVLSSPSPDPVQPDVQPWDFYIWQSSHFSDQTLTVSLPAEDARPRISLSAPSLSPGREYLMLTIDTPSGKELERETLHPGSGRPFSGSIRVPKTTEDSLRLSVYYNGEKYGSYRNWFYGEVKLSRTDTGWKIEKPPAYDGNIALYSQPKDMKKATRATMYIQKNSEQIKSLAREITQGAADDYQKLLLIHDWVTEHIYYDTDRIDSGKLNDLRTTEQVLADKKGVCEDFANLTAALCRSIDIPCAVVAGDAPSAPSDQWVATDEEKPNHAWNEALVDGRWVILDTTWDAGKVYENGKYKEKRPKSWTYFDPTLSLFSCGHRMMEYL